MEITAESSFAPLDYYKKLTNCLANRKNLKLNLSRICGAKTGGNTKKISFITARKLQHKLLAKYNVRKLSEDESIQQIKPIFNIQRVNLNPEKKHDEIYNLPDSYFKTHEKPSLSQFKVPAIPPRKKQKANPEQFTVTSLFSGNFNPQRYSTPVNQLDKSEQIVPFIADPDVILKVTNEAQQKSENSDNREEEMQQLKAYKAIVQESSEYIDSVCFDKSDPIDEISKKLNQKFIEASQSPRESLLSLPQDNLETVEKPVAQSRPVPTFYDQPAEKKLKDDDYAANQLFLEHTKDLFAFLDQDDLFDVNESSAMDFDCIRSIPSDHFLFSSTPSIWHTPKNGFQAMDEWSPYSCDILKKNYEDLDWLEEVFNKSLDMSWESDSSYSMTSNSRQFSPIFRSPPKVGAFNVQDSFSRIISRPKQAFKPNHSCNNNKKEEFFSWWTAIDGPKEATFMFNETPNIFDTKFTLF